MAETQIRAHPHARIRGLSVAQPVAIHQSMPAGLRRECEMLCQYLTGTMPSDYVLGKYADAHCRIDSLWVPAGDSLDALLQKMAARGGPLLQIADAYARLARPRGVVRCKLVLLLAILESAPIHHASLDRAQRGARSFIILGLVGTIARSLGMSVLAITLLGPAHGWIRLSGPRRNSRAMGGR